MTQNNGDQSVDPARADAALLLVQLTTTQQQLTLTKAKLGSLTGTLSTITDAITGASIANAQNAVANAKQSLQTKLDNRNSDAQSALAALQSAQASYDNAQNALAKLTLTASATGVVASISAQVGEFVGGGGTAANAFIVLTGASGLALHGTVGEADIARLALGQVATLTIDAVGTEKRFTGKVTNLDPVATLQQGVPVYGIDITLDVVDPGIRAGMSGSANVIIASKRDVLVVPNLAIRNLGGQRGVQVLRGGEPVALTDVQFGIASDQATEVISGLAEGELVVLPTARSSNSQPPAGPGGQFRVGPGGGPVR
jgi:RND family efflux transporter MFP subunit